MLNLHPRQKLPGTVEVRLKRLKCSWNNFQPHGNSERLKSILRLNKSISTAFKRSSTATLPEKSEASALRLWAYISVLSIARPSKGALFLS